MGRSKRRGRRRGRGGRHSGPALQRLRRKAGDRRPLPNGPLLAGALAGAVIAGVLTAASGFDSGPVGCAAGSGCDAVAASRYASLLGVPTAVWGFAWYGLIAAVALTVRQARLHGQLALALSGVGVAVSIYLTGVSILELDALCSWCVASLVAISGCLGIAVVQEWHRVRGRAIARELGAVALAGVGIVLVLHLYFAGTRAGAEAAAEARALALHLKAVDARFYGASWCPLCGDQKELFGGAAKLLPYVECSPQGPRAPQAPECRAAAIETYPTWEIAGRRHERLLSLEELATLSGFAAESEEPRQGRRGR